MASGDKRGDSEGDKALGSRGVFFERTRQGNPRAHPEGGGRHRLSPVCHPFCHP